MKAHERSQVNTMKHQPHQTDESNPDVYLNVDLVRKPDPKDHGSQKACKNCCDQCRELEKKRTSCS